AGRVIATRRFNKTAETFGVLKLQYENEDLLDWSLGFRYTGPMRVLNNNAGTFAPRGGFLVIDAAVAKHLRWGEREWLWLLGVRNLTDDRQSDLESGAGRDSDYVYGPRTPRTWFSSLKVEW